MKAVNGSCRNRKIKIQDISIFFLKLMQESIFYVSTD